MFISVRGKVCNSLSINELRGGGWPRRRNSFRLRGLRGFLPENLVLTILTHRGDVELLETQRVLEGGEQNGVAAGSATLRGDCLTAVDASDGGDGGLQFRSLGCRYRFPVHNFLVLGFGGQFVKGIHAEIDAERGRLALGIVVSQHLLNGARVVEAEELAGILLH